MRSERGDAAYLWDMLTAARDALEFTSGCTFEQFRTDKLRQSAVERKVEIIGEAARRVSEAFRDAHPEIPWPKVIGLRNIVAHDYSGIRQELMWRVVSLRLPELVTMLDALGLTPPPDPEA